MTASKIAWIQTSRKSSYRSYVSEDGRFTIIPSLFGINGVAYTVTAAYVLSDMHQKIDEKVLTVSEAKRRAQAIVAAERPAR